MVINCIYWCIEFKRITSQHNRKHHDTPRHQILKEAKPFFLCWRCSIGPNELALWLITPIQVNYWHTSHNHYWPHSCLRLRTRQLCVVSVIHVAVFSINFPTWNVVFHLTYANGIGAGARKQKTSTNPTYGSTTAGSYWLYQLKLNCCLHSTDNQ